MYIRLVNKTFFLPKRQSFVQKFDCTDYFKGRGTDAAVPNLSVAKDEPDDTFCAKTFHTSL